MSGCFAKKYTRKAKRIIGHPDYVYPANDIALIRLDEKVPLFGYDGGEHVTTVSAVCLPWKRSNFVYDLKTGPETRFTVMGWGLTQNPDDDPTPDTVLMELRAENVSAIAMQ